MVQYSRRTGAVRLFLRRFELLENMDDNGDGVLSLDEFTAGLLQLGIDCTREEIATVMRYFDDDHSGTLDALELEQIIKKHKVSEASLVEFGGEGVRRLNRCIQAASQPPNFRTAADSRLILDFTKDIPFLKDFNEMQGLQICRALAKTEYASGEWVFSEGEQGHHFFVLLSGEVSLFIGGKEIKTISAISSFGERALQEVR